MNWRSLPKERANFPITEKEVQKGIQIAKAPFIAAQKATETAMKGLAF